MPKSCNAENIFLQNLKAKLFHYWISMQKQIFPVNLLTPKNTKKLFRLEVMKYFTVYKIEFSGFYSSLS